MGPYRHARKSHIETLECDDIKRSQIG